MGTEKARLALEQGKYTCVLTDGKITYSSQSRGVKPLVQFLAKENLPQGLFAADKVVGKATAYLYVLLRVNGLYAKVISKPALAVLREYGISVQYETLAENVINRKGDGICPFEEAVLEIDDPETAYDAILKKMKEFNISLWD